MHSYEHRHVLSEYMLTTTTIFISFEIRYLPETETNKIGKLNKVEFFFSSNVINFNIPRHFLIRYRLKWANFYQDILFNTLHLYAHKRGYDLGENSQ